MSESNKQVGRRFIDAFNRADESVLEEIVAEDVVDNNPRPGQRPGRLAVLDASKFFRDAFPDQVATIVREVAEGDLVALCGATSGTDTVGFMGMAPTGRRFTMAWIDLHRVS